MIGGASNAMPVTAWWVGNEGCYTAVLAGRCQRKERFAPFRRAVHAVLFLRKVPPASPINYCLECLLVHNQKLMTSDEMKNIACGINKAMAVWKSIRDRV